VGAEDGGRGGCVYAGWEGDGPRGEGVGAESVDQATFQMSWRENWLAKKVFES